MRILLVEDEQQIADFLSMSLEAESFAVDVAHNGIKGAELAFANNYDLIILDNQLPGKSGLEICKETRAHGKTCPIIMLSVLAETNMKVDLLNAGADDYLIKPFSLQELIARIRALLRRPRRLETNILAVDDLILDSQRHIVKRGKKELTLTRKEFGLLQFLMKNEGTALTRGMIMEHVWDMKADPYSNTIESHVVTLRKKVDFKQRRKLIHTVPGVGYKLGVNP
jgi:DNA-binding response OmpR family regulator